MSKEKTRWELIEQLKAHRAWIEAMLRKLDEQQMEVTGVQGDWSVKDIIAHLTTWERRGTEWIKSIVQEKEPQVPLAGYRASDMDWLNRETYQKNRNRPLQDILVEFQKSFPLLIEQVQALTEEQLDKTFQADWTDYKPTTVRNIVAWRYYHYKAHGQHIQAWLETIKSKSQSH
ncbi:MAG: ClbS/DfsB family four-helix bundle protein [Candidatus Hodarchaeota archaeon]